MGGQHGVVKLRGAKLDTTSWRLHTVVLFGKGTGEALLAALAEGCGKGNEHLLWSCLLRREVWKTRVR